MRTTVTLDPDTEQLLRRRMAERKISFKQALNEAIRAGLAEGAPKAFRTKTASLGPARLDLTHTGRLLDEMDVAEFLGKDAELRRELQEGA